MTAARRAVWLSAALLAGCGAEAVGTAATGAAIKQQELEAGQAAQQRVQQQFKQQMWQTLQTKPLSNMMGRSEVPRLPL